MSCEQWSDKILDRLAGELDEAQSVELEQHLAECARCESEAGHLEALLIRARAAGDVETRPGTEERIIAAIRAGARGGSPGCERRAKAGAPLAARRSSMPLPAERSSMPLPARLSPVTSRVRFPALRPAPVLAAACLAAVCLAAGFWSGRNSAHLVPGAAPDASPSRHAQPGWSRTPSSSKPTSPRAPEPLSAPWTHDAGATQFAVAPLDAICLPPTSRTDTL